MDKDRLVNTLLDHKFITYDSKKDVALELGVPINDIIGFELVSDDMGLSETLLIYVSSQAHIKKKNLGKFDFKEIYFDECIVLVVQLNRNEVYEILRKKLLTYSVLVNNRPYKKLYVDRNEWEMSWLITDGVYITNFNEIYICSDEMVIRGKYESFQVNIKYKDMTFVEVGGE